jgi:hypothetical protein
MYRQTSKCEGINKDGTQCGCQLDPAWHDVETTRTCLKHWKSSDHTLDRWELIQREITMESKKRNAQFPQGFSEAVKKLRAKYHAQPHPDNHQTIDDYIKNGGKISYTTPAKVREHNKTVLPAPAPLYFDFDFSIVESP